MGKRDWVSRKEINIRCIEIWVQHDLLFTWDIGSCKHLHLRWTQDITGGPLSISLVFYLRNSYKWNKMTYIKLYNFGNER